MTLYNTKHCWICTQSHPINQSATSVVWSGWIWWYELPSFIIIWYSIGYITFLVTLYDTKRCSNSTHTTFSWLISNFSLIMRMNMVIWTPKFHRYSINNVSGYISSDIILQHKTLLNLYTNNILSINKQLQCDYQDEYDNMNPPNFTNIWLLMWLNTFLVKLCNTRHGWICIYPQCINQTTTSVIIRMNMITWSPESHHYMISNVIDYISTEIIQHETLLNLYINHVLSINHQIQCVN